MPLFKRQRFPLIRKRTRALSLPRARMTAPSEKKSNEEKISRRKKAGPIALSPEKEKAFNEWVVKNEKLIHWMINPFFYKYKNYLDRISYSYEDLYTLALGAVSKAFRDFKPELGNQLNTLIIACIENELRTTRSYFSRKKKKGVVFSLSNPITAKEDGGGPGYVTLFSEVIPEKPRASKLLPVELQEIRAGVEKSTLTPREKRIIFLRFGLESGIPLSLKEIAKVAGVTLERIRQIEAAALQKLSKSKQLRELFFGSR